MPSDGEVRASERSKRFTVDESGEGTESEQIVLKGLTAFLLLTCKKNIKVNFIIIVMFSLLLLLLFTLSLLPGETYLCM